MTRANVGSHGRTANVEASGRATNSSASGPLAMRVPWRLVARSAMAEPWNWHAALQVAAQVPRRHDLGHHAAVQGRELVVDVLDARFLYLCSEIVRRGGVSLELLRESGRTHGQAITCEPGGFNRDVVPSRH